MCVERSEFFQFFLCLCASRNFHQVTSKLQWRTTVERHGRILAYPNGRTIVSKVRLRLQVRSAPSMVLCVDHPLHSHTTQSSKARTGPMLSAHGTLFVCITCVFGRRKSITKLETTKNTWKLIEASKTSSFGYSQNANFPLHKSRASIRCLQISSHLLFLLGYVLPSCPTWDISK